jgi:hypothetical protein
MGTWLQQVRDYHASADREWLDYVSQHHEQLSLPWMTDKVNCLGLAGDKLDVPGAVRHERVCGQMLYFAKVPKVADGRADLLKGGVLAQAHEGAQGEEILK